MICVNWKRYCDCVTRHNNSCVNLAPQWYRKVLHFGRIVLIGKTLRLHRGVVGSSPTVSRYICWQKQGRRGWVISHVWSVESEVQFLGPWPVLVTSCFDVQSCGMVSQEHIWLIIRSRQCKSGSRYQLHVLNCQSDGHSIILLIDQRASVFETFRWCN